MFAHSPERVARYEQKTGRKVDLWQIAPQRKEGDDVMLAETQRTAAEIPDGATADWAFPLVSKEQAARLGEVINTETPNAYVRFGWEFNGDWWPWSAAKVGHDQWTADYKAAVDGLRSTAPDAQVVWNPNSGQGGIPEAMKSWPGDDYVDVIGVDVYDWANEDPVKGEGQLDEWAAEARKRGKKIALPEWGVHGVEGKGDNPAFVEDVLAWAERNSDLVVYMAYFDEPESYIANSVGDGQVPKTGEALRVGFEKLAGKAPSAGVTGSTAATVGGNPYALTTEPAKAEVEPTVTPTTVPDPEPESGGGLWGWLTNLRPADAPDDGHKGWWFLAPLRQDKQDEPAEPAKVEPAATVAPTTEPAPTADPEPEQPKAEPGSGAGGKPTEEPPSVEDVRIDNVGATRNEATN